MISSVRPPRAGKSHWISPRMVLADDGQIDQVGRRRDGGRRGRRGCSRADGR
jgi:hypothetical protein